MAKHLALLASSLVLALASHASAVTIYIYTGNPYDTIVDADPPAGSYTTAMSISGSFTAAAPLPANFLGSINDLILSYSFSDGRSTYTESNSTLTGIFGGFGYIGTDANGNIVTWQFSLEQGSFTGAGDELHSLFSRYEIGIDDVGVIAQCLAAPCLDNFVVDRGILSGSPGTWTVVPEPSAGALVALGLTGLAARRRSRDC